MINLNDYIKREYDVSIDRGCKARYYIDEINEFYNNDIPDNIIELIEKGYYELYIDESLKSHDTQKLKDKLKKEYDVEFKDYSGENKMSFYVILSNNLKIENFDRKYSLLNSDFDNIEKFENILSFYNYYISYSEKIDNKWCIFIEPRYSDNITDKIFNSHCYLYHFTDSKSAKSILENGLRCKEKKSYREFPNKIFLYATNKKINDDIKNICRFISKICNISNMSYYGLSILRIKNNRKFDIYNDTAMKEPEAVFTYTNIPKEYISEIKNTKLTYKEVCNYFKNE